MKRRTFFTTLALFLFVFNLGITIICIATFHNTITHAKDRSLDEHYFIASAILQDFGAVESRGVAVESALDSLFVPYSHLSADKKGRLSLYRDKQRVYASGAEAALPDRFLEPPQNGDRLVSIEKIDGGTYSIVSGRLPAPYDLYTLVYTYDTTDAVTAWMRMRNTLFTAGFILSVLLALGLLVLLNRIFSPLMQITQTSRDIAAGDYDTRLPVSGRDELSEMAESFNHMADEIQRQIEVLSIAAEKKQQFIDNFAHELRTPLTAIYGYAEYIQKAALGEADRLAAVGHIMSESRRMQTMAHRLLTLADLRNDQIKWEAQNVSSLFGSVKLALDSRIIEKGVHIEFIGEIDTIRGDAWLLQSLLINLIDNAIKACDAGGHIAVRAVLENGCKTIFIQDDGKGMTADVLRHIEEPFYRGERSRSQWDGGFGLGLSLCRQIAVLHNAELAFTSRPGKGTTVAVTFTTP